MIVPASPEEFEISLEQPGECRLSFPLAMIYPLKLETALFVVSLLLIVSHAFALARPEKAKNWLRAFPRSSKYGALLLLVAAVWFFILVSVMDLGEFSNWRKTVLIATPIAAYLTWKYVEEFLAVRALGMLVILGAEPILEAAFLRPEIAHPILNALVYVYIVLAMFWVGMPYILRDQIAWVSKSEQRWRIASFGGIAYGAVLMALLVAMMASHHGN